MRSFSEIRFRATQELWNFLRFLAPPKPHDLKTVALPLPDPAPIASALRGTSFAQGLEETARRILSGELPLLGYAVQLPDPIPWRRDAVSRQETPPLYFRRVPYLDFARSGDHKIIWELNRHQHWVLLAQTCLITGESRCIETIEREWKSWSLANPFHRGINWASALEVGFRALSWLWVFHLAGSSFTDPFRQAFLRSLYQHGAHLARNLSFFFSPNTHLLGEAVALHALGLLFGKRDWRELGRRVVAAEMEHQVREDGSHFEQSSYYHLYALDMFLFHHVLEPGDEEFRQKLYRMAEYLYAITAPSGVLPMMGDEDGGRFFHPYGPRQGFAGATMATAGMVFCQPAWNSSPEKLAEQALWYLGPDVLNARSLDESAPARSRVFADAGIAVMRTGNLQVIVDAGNMGDGSGGHSHADALQILARSGDVELLIDPGTFTYVADAKARGWFRGNAAHNTVRIDGKDQGVAAGPFRWSWRAGVSVLQWASNQKHDYCHAVCDYSEFRHERRILLIKELRLVVLLDHVKGPSAPMRLVEQYWHPGVPVSAESPNQIRLGAGAYLVFPLGAVVGIETGGENGWRSRVFGQKEESPSIRYSLETHLPTRLWTVLDCSGVEGPRTLRPGTKGFELIADYTAPAHRLKIHFDCEGLPVHYAVSAA